MTRGANFTQNLENGALVGEAHPIPGDRCWSVDYGSQVGVKVEGILTIIPSATTDGVIRVIFPGMWLFPLSFDATTFERWDGLYEHEFYSEFGDYIVLARTLQGIFPCKVLFWEW